MFIEVVKCSDVLYWYANCLGQEFSLVRTYPNEYLVVSADGHTNIIMRSDGKLKVYNED